MKDILLENGGVVREDERTLTERWGRIMGYMRPITDANIGKRQEWKDRKFYILRDEKGVSDEDVTRE